MQPGDEPAPAYQQTPRLSTARPLVSPTTTTTTSLTHPHPHPPSFHTTPAEPHHLHRRQHQTPSTDTLQHAEHLPPLSTALYTAPKSKSSAYYDPTSDHGLAHPHASPHPSQVPRPVLHSDTKTYLVHQTRDPHPYPDARTPASPYNNPYRSPIQASFTHHSPLQPPASHAHIAANMEAMSHSPVSPTVYQPINRGAVQPPPPQYERRPSVKEEVRTDALGPLIPSLTIHAEQAPPPAPKRDPMSLSSIMDSGADPEPPAKTQHLPPIADTRAFSKPASNPLFVKQEALPSPATAELTYPDPRAAVPFQSMPPVASAPPPSQLVPRELPAPDEAQVEAALAHIETKEMNEIDTTGIDHEREKQEYESQCRKRTIDVASAEDSKRKVRRENYGIP